MQQEATCTCWSIEDSTSVSANLKDEGGKNDGTCRIDSEGGISHPRRDPAHSPLEAPRSSTHGQILWRRAKNTLK